MLQPLTHGLIAFQITGQQLPLQVCHSAAGFYIGTLNEDGWPLSRESEEYFTTSNTASTALNNGTWTQRPQP
ncbi:hypothetical protein C5U62_32775 [Pseudomonas protegens]|uniref:Uncharacterized protein n=1 Tax=Pseudomonas protegens TaxID=380021 RepID=A0A2T6GAV0_9PSED|nr:hypothetical protein [Pseudomonas protegens]PUA41277.1 hypothetical protein C5U62_32775 [Pseudomonas protegens]